jgi:DNA excision repair protein ERCC-4
VPRKVKPLLTFIQDTREQRAFNFGAVTRREFADGGTRIEGLSEGDYSCAIDDGDALSIRIERKSHGDVTMCCGWERERFVRELERLTQYEYRAIVIEASADDILKGYERSSIPGKSVMASLLCWSVSFNLPIFFGETHPRAGGIAQRLLTEFAVHHLRAAREAGTWEQAITEISGNGTQT